MLNKVHHINFVVQNLDDAIERYEKVFGLQVVRRDRLDERGAKTARFRIGDIWIVLVQPTDPDGAPGRCLAANGEGFFLISYQVDNILGAAAKVKENGARLLNETPRHGLDDWRVIDIDPDDTNGVLCQLVESAES
jgi:methylmalonyl-CoA/ethylmalonyl-CoA epimerase